MDWIDFGNPPPRIDTTRLGDIPLKHRATAGTSRPCKHCGRPTYRTVGSVPVCSYCTDKEPDKWPTQDPESIPCPEPSL